jgi:Flp pilus assembly protein TadG
LKAALLGCGKIDRVFSASWHSRSGAAAVEFSLTFPILMLLLYGIIELSHYAYADIALADAAKSGARYAMVRGATSPQPAASSDIATYVKGQIVLLDPASVTVQTVFLPDNNPGSAIAVKLSYPFVPFLPGLNYLSATTIKANSQMTITQ